MGFECSYSLDKGIISRQPGMLLNLVKVIGRSMMHEEEEKIEKIAELINLRISMTLMEIDLETLQLIHSKLSDDEDA